MHKPDILCTSWRLHLSNGEPVGELVAPPAPGTDRTRRTRRTATPAVQIPKPADLDAPETSRWSWPELLTEITRMHFEGNQR